MSDVLIYLSLALVVLWTIRLARSKGRNPFIWGGLSLALMLIPSWHPLLGMAPMVLLLFLKSPQVARQDVKQETVNCPKCRAVHAAGHTYCVNCGWELGKPYFEEAPQPRVPEETSRPQVGASEPERRSPASEPPQPAAEVLPVAEVEVQAGEAAPEAPAEDKIESPIPVFRQPLTPVTLTERGVALFDQGKFQEAIDQFTKAIAIDPKYLPAWARRAEAYVRLGRDSKAEEDRRHIDGLGGQTPG